MIFQFQLLNDVEYHITALVLESREINILLKKTKQLTEEFEEEIEQKTTIKQFIRKFSYFLYLNETVNLLKVFN